MYEAKNRLKSTNKWDFMKSALESLTERQLIETIFSLEKCNLLVIEMSSIPVGKVTGYCQTVGKTKME